MGRCVSERAHKTGTSLATAVLDTGKTHIFGPSAGKGGISMRLPRTISAQHMGSVAAFLIAGSMVSFALGQQIGHATHVPRAATSHQSQVAGALGAGVAVPAP